jgi:hypothetical protein
MTKKDEVVNILDYTIANLEKWDRAINGTVDRLGKQRIRAEGGSCGVGENATDMEKLAEYDRLGGLILKDGEKIKTGSFYDFENKAPRTEPELIFLAEIEGEIVDATEQEVKTIRKTKKKIIDLKAKKRGGKVKMVKTKQESFEE